MVAANSERARIGTSLLAKLYLFTHVAGAVAAKCGLASGTPIVIGGDGVCAAVGVGSV